MGDWRHNSGSYPLNQVEGSTCLHARAAPSPGIGTSASIQSEAGWTLRPVFRGTGKCIAQHSQVTNTLKIWSLLSWCNMVLPPRLKTVLISFPFLPPSHHPSLLSPRALRWKINWQTFLLWSDSSLNSFQIFRRLLSSNWIELNWILLTSLVLPTNLIFVGAD